MKRTPSRTAIHCFLVSLAFTLLSMTSSHVARAQCEIMKAPPSNNGTDFLLVYEQNDNPQHQAFDSAACFVYIGSTSDHVDTVVISCLHAPFPTQKFGVD